MKAELIFEPGLLKMAVRIEGKIYPIDNVIIQSASITDQANDHVRKVDLRFLLYPLFPSPVVHAPQEAPITKSSPPLGEVVDDLVSMGMLENYEPYKNGDVLPVTLASTPKSSPNSSFFSTFEDAIKNLESDLFSSAGIDSELLGDVPSGKDWEEQPLPPAWKEKPKPKSGEGSLPPKIPRQRRPRRSSLVPVPQPKPANFSRFATLEFDEKISDEKP